MIESYKKLKRKHKNIFAFFVIIALILIWRGVWGLADIFLFPSNQTISFLFSIIIGLVILAILRFTVSKFLGS